jgi:hypothetical protein
MHSGIFNSTAQQINVRAFSKPLCYHVAIDCPSLYVKQEVLGDEFLNCG